MMSKYRQLLADVNKCEPSAFKNFLGTRDELIKLLSLWSCIFVADSWKNQPRAVGHSTKLSCALFMATNEPVIESPPR
eukprot:2096826-Amphidinium_carterae.1